jgi:hypothetical protein
MVDLPDHVLTELERKVRALLAVVPTTPVEQFNTTGEFWLAVMRLRTEIKIIDAIRAEPRLR